MRYKLIQRINPKDIESDRKRYAMPVDSDKTVKPGEPAKQVSIWSLLTGDNLNNALQNLAGRLSLFLLIWIPFGRSGVWSGILRDHTVRQNYLYDGWLMKNRPESLSGSISNFLFYLLIPKKVSQKTILKRNGEALTQVITNSAQRYYLVLKKDAFGGTEPASSTKLICNCLRRAKGSSVV